MKSKIDIIWYNSVDSTNEIARREIMSLDNLSVLSAMSQTSGHGQRGNSWLSEEGKNLLFSIVLKYASPSIGSSPLPGPVQAYDQFVISKIASLSVVDLLATYDIQAKIKWPNDIYVEDKKICGILIEHAVQGKWLKSSIIGIGLNINQQNFDVSLPNPTSMILSSPDRETDFDIKALLVEFMEIFVEYIDRFCNITGGYNRLEKLYLSQLWLKDISAEFMDMTTTPASRFRGTIRGISPFGHLLVEMDNGEMREFSFKEIAYIN